MTVRLRIASRAKVPVGGPRESWTALPATQEQILQGSGAIQVVELVSTTQGWCSGSQACQFSFRTETRVFVSQNLLFYTLSEIEPQT